MNLPFKIATLPLVPGGQIALCRMPGSASLIEEDIAEIVDLGCACVVSLATSEELHRYGAKDLSSLLQSRGVEWKHFPIDDYGTPPEDQTQAWEILSNLLQNHLKDNRTVLIHCLAGVGRSGMIALRLMVERGAEPTQALAYIRQARPGAVERPAQYNWAIIQRPNEKKAPISGPDF